MQSVDEGLDGSCARLAPFRLILSKEDIILQCLKILVNFLRRRRNPSILLFSLFYSGTSIVHFAKGSQHRYQPKRVSKKVFCYKLM